ncbi:tRNA 4-thiouridine(8) synthase ThiI [Paraneptunicella aestuarii]|uniref:tRNA uracil 4-sulfurtransferase ThiI n=1 Tax=Paraneptunicella aestuarii TaxID=2831148 RepID=UPI001E5B8B24|nr:tRNA uracil 4-sulfurtransferase ThiI [Paraneptunicella aestuarii]UAA37530.1 tRNA 4-thiouridine(8) synthase ThiI [Paraneptunicella aestuarii]
MKFIVKLHPEITIKSASVRKRFTRLLESNIRVVFKHRDVDAAIKNSWDKLEVRPRNQEPDHIERVRSALAHIPGIEQVLEVKESQYTDFDDIYQQVSAVWGPRIADKRFVVRVKRRGKHDFTSVDVARYVGGGLNQNFPSGGVSLNNPDVEIQLEVDKDKLLLIEDRFKGLGGMPLPTQEDVLSLISGGFDSSVASFEFIRRGAKTHYCFFNLGGREHELGVRQICYYLWQKYGMSHRVKFISVDFAPVVNDIVENCESGYMGVVLKRMMLRAASIVADNLQIKALITGECVGQVASQTLTNLHVIDQVTDKLVLRPLICMDKSDIIKRAREIGTAELSETIPEYCGVISRSPNVKASLEKTIEEEQKLNLELIEQVVRASNVLDIRNINQVFGQEAKDIEAVSDLPQDAVVLDIRSPEEEDASPLELDTVEVKHVPFYKLERVFSELDQSKQYYLYCDRGVMSKYHTLLLRERGFQNTHLYQPAKPSVANEPSKEG